MAATGRLSSSDPNLQNIPIRTPLGRRIRRAFVAGAPDVVLVSADYSQIELRILAHVAGDAHLKEAFAAGKDIHRDSAALVLRKEPADVTPDERSMAKMVNFGIAYGMSDFGLASRAGIPRDEARAFIDRYFATYSGISYYMLHVKETARAQGFVTTLLGRRREIPELRSTNRSLVAAGERMAINMPIQGTAADIMKIAMIRVGRAPARRGLPGAAPAPGPRRAAPRGSARRGGPPGARRPGDDGGRPDPRRPAHGRRQGRRRLGVDDAVRAGASDVPELPEVETVARDLRGLIVGATITGARGRLAAHDRRRTRRSRRSPTPWPGAGWRRSAGGPSSWSWSSPAGRTRAGPAA